MLFGSSICLANRAERPAVQLLGKQKKLLKEIKQTNPDKCERCHPKIKSLVRPIYDACHWLKNPLSLKLET
jgi:hypothetical protein